MLDPSWTDVDAAVGYLVALREHGPWNLTAIIADGGTEHITLTDRREAEAWLARRAGKANLHYRANPASRPTGFGGSVKKEDVDAAEYIAGDIDLDKVREGDPLHGRSLVERKTLTVKRLQESRDPGPPTFIVDTGGGLQALWKLEDPINDLALVERINRHIITEFGGDPGTHNIERLLRLPGTTNLPNAVKRARGRVPAPARLLEANDARYTEFDFTAAPAVPEKAEVDIEFDAPVDIEDLDGLDLPERLATIVRDGRLPEPKEGDDSRSAWLFDGVCGLVRARVPDEVILGLLLDPQWGIAESVLSRPQDDQLRYAQRQVRSAHQVVQAERADDSFEDDLEPDEVGGVATPDTLESTYAESLSWEEPKWLVEGFVPWGGLVQNYGVRKALKTFVSLDLALCIATGRDYHGQKVVRGKVTYVAAEGSKSQFRDRVTAWLRLNKVDARELDGWWFQVNRPINLTDKRAVDTFIKGLRAGRERQLIVFDTLSKNTGGVDEDTKGMKMAVNGANAVRFATGAAVLLIHHEGKDSSKKGRGSTVLPGDVDLSLRTQRLGNGRCTLSVDEARDTDEGKTFAFELVTVIVGELEDTSAAVRLMADQVTGPKTTDDKVLIDIAEQGEYATPKDLINEEAEGRSKANVYKVIKRLRDAGLVRPDDPVRATAKGVNAAMMMGAAVAEDD